MSEGDLRTKLRSLAMLRASLTSHLNYSTTSARSIAADTTPAGRRWLWCDRPLWRGRPPPVRTYTAAAGKQGPPSRRDPGHTPARLDTAAGHRSVPYRLCRRRATAAGNSDQANNRHDPFHAIILLAVRSGQFDSRQFVARRSSPKRHCGAAKLGGFLRPVKANRRQNRS